MNLRQQVAQAFLLFHTIRYLRPIQIYGRLWYKLYHPKPDLRSPPDVRSRKNDWHSIATRNISLLGPHRFCFLNQTHEIATKEQWNGPALSKLWLYNLHYFDDLNAADASGRMQWHQELIKRWITENRPGIGCGWESYPLSLRIVNWIKWGLNGNELNKDILFSLTVQIRYLRQRIEYHLLGNHLFVNAKALIFAGLYFSGKEADRWLETGERILKSELQEQILEDGGHIERSPMYHLLILEDLLDLINLYKVYGRPRLSGLKACAEKMQSWSRIMRHPDNEIPFFNDCALGIAASPIVLDKYASILGLEIDKYKSKNTYYLHDSGFLKINYKQAVLFADVGSVGPDYLPAHAHAGTLSTELSIGDCRIIVNSGTSDYSKGVLREYQRSTSAHNTVVVDGENSSQVWGSFRVARRAKTKNVHIKEQNKILIAKATHTGYSCMKKPVLHQRSWRIGDDTIEIIDQVLGQGNHRIEVMYLLHPNIHVEAEGDTLLLICASNKPYIIFTPDKILETSIEEAKYYPKFGESCNSKRILCRLSTELPCEMMSKFNFPE
jgi:uncharacterized heparinase superfamily protein